MSFYDSAKIDLAKSSMTLRPRSRKAGAQRFAALSPLKQQLASYFLTLLIGFSLLCVLDY
jgi:hypothetical protein